LQILDPWRKCHVIGSWATGWIVHYQAHFFTPFNRIIKTTVHRRELKSKHAGVYTWILHESEAFIGKASKGDVVVLYFKPLATQHMKASGSPEG
jgi:hypothetical protein